MLYNRCFCDSVNFDCVSDNIPIHPTFREKHITQCRIPTSHPPYAKKSDSLHSSHTTGHLSPRKRRAQRNRTSQLARANGGDIHRKRGTVRLIRQIKLSNRDDRPSHAFQLPALPCIATPLSPIRTVMVAVILDTDQQFRIGQIERNRGTIIECDSRNSVIRRETPQSVRI